MSKLLVGNNQKFRGDDRRRRDTLMDIGRNNNLAHAVDVTRANLVAAVNHSPPRSRNVEYIHASSAASSARKGWWTRSYLVDWIICLLLFAIKQIISAVVSPRQSIPVVVGDPRISLPFLADTIPSYANILLSICAPFAVVVLMQVIYAAVASKPSVWINFHNIHHFALAIFAAYTITTLTVCVLKNVTGVPRPNHFANPDPDGNGRQSFPSDHSAVSWTGWFLLALYLAGQFSLFYGRAPSLGLVITVMLAFVPPIIVCVTRYLDNKHHWIEIVTGSLIGCLVAVMVYGSLFESLLSRRSGVARNR